LNPTCSSAAALRFQGGAEVAGGAGGAGPLRTGPAVSPEDARSWSLGLNFTPMEGFLQGMNFDLSYYKLRINKILDSKAVLAPNDPRNVLCTDAGPNCNYIVRANPNLPITDPANARFNELLNEIASNPRSTIKNLSAIQFIRDVAITNAGYREISGVDFDWRYDFGLGRLGNLGASEDWGNINLGMRGDYRLTDEQLPSDLPGTEVTDNFEGNTGGRLRWRGRLGWSSMDGAWNVTSFVNYTPHGAPAEALPPPCFWAAGFGPNSCYPGSPYWGPYDSYPLYIPSYYWFDLNLSYNTQDKAPSPYLQNLTISLTINNVFNRQGAFTYTFASGRGSAADQGAMNGYLQRSVSLTLSKVW
jgi:hypothetical protein